MFRLIGTMKIKPDKIEQWEEIITRRRAQVLRDEDFTLVYDFYRSALDPCEYVVIEGFADESGHERHLKQSIGHEAMIECFAEPPSLQKVWPVKGCASDPEG
ncbi:putative quinol monooxygenase [Novosphingobium sp. BL-52-GroH]|uniref:putative quinol monooxygenase n=1 Tax=Novosphingobium sp. BL-52-GroH TaxID=3349877 RepID=UPI00384F3459